MNSHAGRLIVHDREIHLEPSRDLFVGDTLEVIRGNGPREGAYMGIATVTELDDTGPILSVDLDPERRRSPAA
jgi:hypothetical protein